MAWTFPSNAAPSERNGTLDFDWMMLLKQSGINAEGGQFFSHAALCSRATSFVSSAINSRTLARTSLYKNVSFMVREALDHPSIPTSKAYLRLRGSHSVNPQAKWLG